MLTPRPLPSKSSYRRLRHPASKEPGTLRQQFAALSSFLDLQQVDRLTGQPRERRWTVCHAIACDRAIPMDRCK